MVTMTADPHSQAVWADMLVYLRQFHAPMVRQWFTDLKPLQLAAGVLTLRCGTAIQQTYLTMKCRDVFNEAAQRATGKLISVTFVCEGTGASGQNLYPEVILCPDYIFDNFVVGPTNELACASCMAVARRPGKNYNPLFLYGAAGLGKTHLLQATCQELVNHQPDARILYISCEHFINHFMESVKSGDLSQFRDLYRHHVDVLVVDDIHFLGGRERSQEEFFHTFNALFQQGRQIILSSDSPPVEIQEIEERLVSRFASGMLARLERPSFETRLLIVQKKSRLRGVVLPDDVAAYIARRFENNIRELEGALTKLQGYAMLNGGKYDLDIAKVALGDMLPPMERAVSIQRIIGHVTAFYNVRLQDLQSKRRHRSVTLPRQVCMYLARKYTTHSLEEIGGFFGGRDHTTVMHAVRAVKDLCRFDTVFTGQLEQLEAKLPAELGRPAAGSTPAASRNYAAAGR